MKKSLNVFWTIVIIIWPHSSKHVLIIRNVWDKYLCFPFDFPKQNSIRNWIEKWMENIFSKCFRPHYIQEPRRILFLSVRSWCWISVESASPPAWLLSVWVPDCCHNIHCYFMLLWTCLGDWYSCGYHKALVTCGLWLLSQKNKMAKILYMFYNVVLTCAIWFLGRFAGFFFFSLYTFYSLDWLESIWTEIKIRDAHFCWSRS